MKKLLQILSSKRFLAAVLALFGVQALWIALSARYPMAADEDFHFGIINIYAHHISPFFAAQPAGADAFGAVFRDPSYLYHYVLSFPLRLFIGFGMDQSAQIIALRIINIIIAVTALYLFRRLLGHTKLSPAMSNVVCLVYILLPPASTIAGEINYDNLFLLCTAGALLLASKINRQLHNKTINPLMLGSLLIVCLLSSLVKFPFLVIFFVIVLWLGCGLVKQRRSLRKLVKTSFTAFKLKPMATTVLIAGIVLSAGLFVERYGYNAWKYHTPTPECDTVLSIEECQEYGPWVRNYKFKTLYYGNRQNWNAITFTKHWFINYYYSLLWVLNGPYDNYTIGPPIKILYFGGIGFAIVSGAAILATMKKLLKDDPVLIWLSITMLVYLVILWTQNYTDFKSTGQAVAQQGRYWLPILIVLLALCFKALAIITRKLPRRLNFVRPIIASALVCILLQGGGILTFILRSNDNWNWQNNIVQTVNNTTRSVIKPLIIKN